MTLGADKGYDTREFVAALRTMAVTPHVTQNTTNRASAIDERTTRHPGYALSQRSELGPFPGPLLIPTAAIGSKPADGAA